MLRPDVALEPALRAYEDDRRRKTAALLARGRRTARMMRMTNPVGCALRELAIRMIPVTTFAKLMVGISRRAGTDVTGEQPVVKPRLHSTGDASPLAALLLPQILPVFAVVAPCQRGASPVSVRRRGSTTVCYGS